MRFGTLERLYRSKAVKPEDRNIITPQRLLQIRKQRRQITFPIVALPWSNANCGVSRVAHEFRRQLTISLRTGRTSLACKAQPCIEKRDLVDLVILHSQLWLRKHPPIAFRGCPVS